MPVLTLVRAPTAANSAAIFSLSGITSATNSIRQFVSYVGWTWNYNQAQDTVLEDEAAHWQDLVPTGQVNLGIRMSNEASPLNMDEFLGPGGPGRASQLALYAEFGLAGVQMRMAALVAPPNDYQNSSDETRNRTSVMLSLIHI